MGLYLIPNGPMQTNAAFAAVTTGAALKTLLQVKPGAQTVARIIEWGASFDASAVATPGKVELIETDVNAVVTASVANDITKYDADALLAGDPTTALISTGVLATGYTATLEGTIGSTRNLDAPQFISGTTQFIKQFPLGREPIIQPAKFMRIRVNFSAGGAVNAFCYVIIAV